MNGFFVLPEMNGARSLRFDRSDFAACKRRIFFAKCAKIERKSDRHGGGAAAGVSRLSVYFRFLIIDRIFAVMRPDPDLTQTGIKLLPKSRTK